MQDLQKMDSTGTADHFTMIVSLDDNAEKLSEMWHNIGELFGSSEDAFHLIRCYLEYAKCGASPRT